MSAPGWRQRRRSSLAWAALAGALAVALLALALSTPPAQSAEAQCDATTRVTGLATALTLNREGYRRIDVSATGKAGISRRDGTSFVFPITRGQVNKDQLCGRIVHADSAGLAFTEGGKRLVFNGFVIDPDQRVLYADVEGRSEGEDRYDVPFMRLHIQPGDVLRGPGVLALNEVNVTLTAAAAHALNQKFDPNLFEAGMPMGKTYVMVHTEL